MNFLEKYYNTIIKYDLINKFNYQNVEKIPELKYIILNLGCKTSELKNLATDFLALQLITKTKGKLTTSKKSNILLKIRKGNPVGCVVKLKKKKMYLFLLNFILHKLPLMKTNFKLNIQNKNSITFCIENILIFNKLEKNYMIFNNTKNLHITIVTNTSSTTELYFLINSLKLMI